MYIHFFDILLIFLKIRFTTPNFQFDEDFSIFLWGWILQNDPRKLSLDSHWIRKNANPGFAFLRIHANPYYSRSQFANPDSHRIWIRESRFATNPGIRINANPWIRIESGFASPESQRIQGFAFCESLDSHCESNVVNLDPQRLRDSRIRESRFAWIRKIWIRMDSQRFAVRIHGFAEHWLLYPKFEVKFRVPIIPPPPQS